MGQETRRLGTSARGDGGAGKRCNRLVEGAQGIPVVISVGGPDLGVVVAEAPRVPSEPYWAAADYADL